MMYSKIMNGTFKDWLGTLLARLCKGTFPSILLDVVVDESVMIESFAAQV